MSPVYSEGVARATTAVFLALAVRTNNFDYSLPALGSLSLAGTHTAHPEEVENSS
jgi:hypothetical protein